MSKANRDVLQVVPAIPQALRALDKMDRQLTTAKTYDEIRRIIREAKAIEVLGAHVEVVKNRAQLTIIRATHRIGEEIQKVRKASGRPPKKLLGTVRIVEGRRAAIPSGTARSRFMKLAAAGTDEIDRVVAEIQARGRDATVTAVLEELKGGSKAERRAEREQTLAKKIQALPSRRFGIILADPPWSFTTRSARGESRSAKNHYPTMTHEAIQALDVASLAAPNAVLFLWGVVPMLPEALSVMAVWGFTYRSATFWDKQRDGTGYWVRSRVEILLIGTRGNPPAPHPALPGLLSIRRAEHSAKPEAFAQLIEAQYPNTLRIELFARTRRTGWDAWGAEAPREDSPVESEEYSRRPPATPPAHRRDEPAS